MITLRDAGEILGLPADVRGHGWISVEIAGQVLGLPRSTAYDRARDGTIPTVRHGNRVRVPVLELLELVGGRPDQRQDPTPGDGAGSEEERPAEELRTENGNTTVRQNGGRDSGGITSEVA